MSEKRRGKLSTTEVKILQILDDGPKEEPEVRYAMGWQVGGPKSSAILARRNMERCLNRLKEAGKVCHEMVKGRIKWNLSD